MSSLEQVVKWGVAIAVLVLVIWGISKFGGNILDFFRNLGGSGVSKTILSFVK
ncbi:MAG TPA: hypothetical protein VJ142_01420 [Candidatus Nanoarchaeia archaeon]|nr:hypothetical protein [Candidatus Nanoarchaeia archaeon]